MGAVVLVCSTSQYIGYSATPSFSPFSLFIRAESAVDREDCSVVCGWSVYGALRVFDHTQDRFECGESPVVD